MKELKQHTLEEMQQLYPYYKGIDTPNQLHPGDKYNYLTIIYKTRKNKAIHFVCRCDCGNYTIISQQHIKDGHTKSCGCLVGETSSKNNVIDLTGQVFGRLTVLKQIKNLNLNNSRAALWLCECSCYNEKGEHPKKIVRGDSLRKGLTQSCGCINKERITILGKNSLIDLTNQKFGHWTVLSRAENQYSENGSQYTMWLCECDCKNKTKKIVAGNSLKNGTSTSCGCVREFKGEEKIKQILNENNISFEIQKTFPTCKIKKLLHFDFYIPEGNYLIEYDGILHFQATGGLLGTEEKVLKNQKYDKFKNQWCKDNNITLIRIPYTHLNEICLEDLIPETSNFIVSAF